MYSILRLQNYYNRMKPPNKYAFCKIKMRVCQNRHILFFSFLHWGFPIDISLCSNFHDFCLVMPL